MFLMSVTIMAWQRGPACGGGCLCTHCQVYVLCQVCACSEPFHKWEILFVFWAAQAGMVWRPRQHKFSSYHKILSLGFVYSQTSCEYHGQKRLKSEVATCMCCIDWLPEDRLCLLFVNDALSFCLKALWQALCGFLWTPSVSWHRGKCPVWNAGNQMSGYEHRLNVQDVQDAWF